ncbi:MAG: HAD hydrolase-like protein, partial [Clostridia bacterium]|nr:HAD hydrolase-like protein [Clostridia bacterium]
GTADRSSVLMIGDREHDIIGARENGLDSLGVLFGYGSRNKRNKRSAIDFRGTEPVNSRCGRSDAFPGRAPFFGG